MFNLINYIDCCSNSFLETMNEMTFEELNVDKDGKINFQLTKKFKEIFEYKLNEIINNLFDYGYYNVLVNTCIPENNWKYLKYKEKNNLKYIRIDESILNSNKYKSLLRSRYYFTDKTLVRIDLLEINIYLNKLFKDFNKPNFYKFVNPRLDIIDVYKIFESNVNLVKIPYTEYHILGDCNILFFFNPTKIPEFLVDNVKMYFNF